MTGLLYEHGTEAVQIFVVATQILALIILFPLLRRRPPLT
jgi:hypothetical protein